jgi:hypothetical protein
MLENQEIILAAQQVNGNHLLNEGATTATIEARAKHHVMIG